MTIFFLEILIIFGNFVEIFNYFSRSALRLKMNFRQGCRGKKYTFLIRCREKGVEIDYLCINTVYDEKTNLEYINKISQQSNTR